MTPNILHITFAADWQQAQQAGDYRAASLETDGFIHCSTSAQLVTVANAFYSGQGELLVLVIDPERLTAALRWEAPAHPNPDQASSVPDDALFPHVYGPINLDAVMSTVALVPDAGGIYQLPAEL